MAVAIVVSIIQIWSARSNTRQMAQTIDRLRTVVANVAEDQTPLSARIDQLRTVMAKLTEDLGHVSARLAMLAALSQGSAGTGQLPTASTPQPSSTNALQQPAVIIQQQQQPDTNRPQRSISTAPVSVITQTVVDNVLSEVPGDDGSTAESSMELGEMNGTRDPKNEHPIVSIALNSLNPPATSSTASTLSISVSANEQFTPKRLGNSMADWLGSNDTGTAMEVSESSKRLNQRTRKDTDTADALSNGNDASFQELSGRSIPNPNNPNLVDNTSE